jgi:hypothetical protein
MQMQRAHMPQLRWYAALLIALAVLMPTFFASLNSTTRVDSDGLRLTVHVFGLTVHRKLIRGNQIHVLSLISSVKDAAAAGYQWHPTKNKNVLRFSLGLTVVMFLGTGVDIRLNNGDRILVGSNTPQALIDAIRNVQNPPGEMLNDEC